MKKTIALILSVLLTLSLASCKQYPYEAEYVEMGIPLAEYYIQGGVERCVWDIEYFDGGLYVGSGNYDKNKGPVYMTHYSFKEKEWKFDTTLLDEQIERFFIFDNKLYAAGCDPQTSWSYGNIYHLENGSWITNNKVPGGVHNFDLVKFDGKLFAGLGVVEGDSPIVMTEDEKNWTSLALYKDGNIYEIHGADTTRVYDFFVLDNTLYAYLYVRVGQEKTVEIYRYDGEKFVYHSDLLANIKYSKSTFAHIAQKVEFRGTQYIATGYLYKTDDMITAEEINLEENTTVNDLRVIDDTLYLLCNKMIENEDGTKEFKVSVLQSKTGEEFSEMFHFNYPVRALSFTYANKRFYFGMGYGTRAKKEYEENGMVLSVKNPL